MKIAQLMTKNYYEVTGKNIGMDFIYKKPRPGDVSRHLADISYARKILGYKPKILLDEGIRKYLEWCLEKIHVRK